MIPVPASSVARAPEREPTLRELDELASSRIIGKVVGARLRLWPIALIFVAFLVWVDASVWRWALVIGAIGSFAALAWYERGFGRGRLTARQILPTAWISGLAQLAVVFVIGGLAGPAAPALPLVALVMSLIAGGRIGLWFVLAIQIPIVWVFAWVQASGVLPDLVPEAWHGLFAPPGTPGPGPWIGALFMTFVLFGGMMLGRILRGVLLEMLREQIADREEQLELHADSARTLTRLSAEIAHELKNPLASIKGLSALVRKDLEGVPAERMDVLRREVDRMQGILEEFLNYSRPLVPLDEERVDLVELARDVIALHEAIAAQRPARIDAPRVIGSGDGEVHLRCDPRKIKQVLINLVQNALDASPPGGHVHLEVEREREGASIRVIDEGGGLAEGAAEKIFGVGFTTKPEGSGIGLAVARGLARQHGGELTLENGARAGCVATLRLPPVPRADSAEAASAPGGATSRGVVAA